MTSEVQLQRDYYTRTAADYESLHVTENDEHSVACSILQSLCLHHGFQSILDVGSGTGRALSRLSQAMPTTSIIGIEPVEALREIGYANGLSKEQLVNGDATQLDYPDNSFDVCCEFGMLHHVPNPQKAVSEMLRVAKKAIFISDSNRFGQGSLLSRYFKLIAWKLKLWPMVNFLKTRGKGYHWSEGDGLAYSYSVFDNYDLIKRECDEVMIFNLTGGGRRTVTEAQQIGLFGLIQQTGR